jgi:RNA polymerase sigma factor (sigma-70 family)
MRPITTLRRSSELRTNPRTETTTRLVLLAADGDDDAWDRLVHELGGLVRSVIRSYRLAEADAADVEQTTWMRLVEHVDRLREPACVGDWLATTARRECLQTLARAARVIPRDELPQLVDETARHADAQIIGERDRALRRGFERLHPRDRALLRLTLAVPPLSYEQIAARLQMPVGSVGPTRIRALQRLRREVDQVDPLALVA